MMHLRSSAIKVENLILAPSSGGFCGQVAYRFRACGKKVIMVGIHGVGNCSPTDIQEAKREGRRWGLNIPFKGCLHITGGLLLKVPLFPVITMRWRPTFYYRAFWGHAQARVVGSCLPLWVSLRGPLKKIKR